MCLLFTFQGFGRHPARGEPVQAAVRCRVRGSLQRLHHAKVGNNAVVTPPSPPCCIKSRAQKTITEGILLGHSPGCKWLLALKHLTLRHHHQAGINPWQVAMGWLAQILKAAHPLSLMLIELVSQFYIFLLNMFRRLLSIAYKYYKQCLKRESPYRNFQPGEDPTYSRGLLREGPIVGAFSVIVKTDG